MHQSSFGQSVESVEFLCYPTQSAVAFEACLSLSLLTNRGVATNVMEIPATANCSSLLNRDASSCCSFCGYVSEGAMTNIGVVYTYCLKSRDLLLLGCNYTHCSLLSAI